METTSIIMGLIGFLLLYGGLSCCIGIAWHHSKTTKKEKTEKTIIPTDTGFQ